MNRARVIGLVACVGVLLLVGCESEPTDRQPLQFASRDFRFVADEVAPLPLVGSRPRGSGAASVMTHEGEVLPAGTRAYPNHYGFFGPSGTTFSFYALPAVLAGTVGVVELRWDEATRDRARVEFVREGRPAFSQGVLRAPGTTAALGRECLFEGVSSANMIGRRDDAGYWLDSPFPADIVLIRDGGRPVEPDFFLFDGRVVPTVYLPEVTTDDLLAGLVTLWSESTGRTWTLESNVVAAEDIVSIAIVLSPPDARTRYDLVVGYTDDGCEVVMDVGFTVDGEPRDYGALPPGALLHAEWNGLEAYAVVPGEIIARD